MSRTRCSVLHVAPQSRDPSGTITMSRWTPVQQRTASRCAAPGERAERFRLKAPYMVQRSHNDVAAPDPIEPKTKTPP